MRGSFTLIRQGAAVLWWSCCVYGVPVTELSTVESVTDSVNNDDFTSRIDWGAAWNNFLGSHLTDQCAPGYGPAQLQPAINLYSCMEMESSGQLTRFFSGMGFNVTQQRLALMKYVQDQQRTTAESGSDNMETTTATTFVPKFTGTAGLTTLLRQIAVHADGLCLNTDAFINCMDQFLFACYPNTTTPDDDSTPSTTPEISATSTASYDGQWLRDVSSFVDMFNTNRTEDNNSSTPTETYVPVTESVTENASFSTEFSTSSEYMTTETSQLTRNYTAGRNGTDTIVIEEIDIIIMVPERDDDDDESESRSRAPVGFFGLPYMINAARISQFLRRELQILCESNSEVGPKNHRPLSDVMGGLFCLLDNTKTDSQSGRCQRDTEPYKLLDRAYFNCLVNDIHEHCTKNGADTIHMLIDEYEDTVTGIAQEMTATTETTTETTTDVMEVSITPEIISTNATRRNATVSPFWWLLA